MSYNLNWLRSVVKHFIDMRKPNMLLISSQPNLVQFIDTNLSDLYTRMNIDLDHRLKSTTDAMKNSVPEVAIRDVNHLYKIIMIQINSLIHNMLKLIHISKTISQRFDSHDNIDDDDDDKTSKYFELLISSYEKALSLLPSSEFQLNFLPKFDVIPAFDISIPKHTNLSLKIYLPDENNNNDLRIQNTSRTNINSFPYPIIIQMIKDLFRSEQSSMFATTATTTEDENSTIQLNMDNFQRLIEDKKLDFNAIRPYIIAITDALNGHNTQHSANLVDEIYSRLLAYYITTTDGDGGGTRVSPYRDFIKNMKNSTNESRIFKITLLMQYGPLISLSSDYIRK